MTPREQYEAECRDLGLTWDQLGPETRHAYETGAPRWQEGRGVGAVKPTWGDKPEQERRVG